LRILDLVVCANYVPYHKRDSSYSHFFTAAALSYSKDLCLPLCFRSGFHISGIWTVQSTSFKVVGAKRLLGLRSKLSQFWFEFKKNKKSSNAATLRATWVRPASIFRCLLFTWTETIDRIKHDARLEHF
jgi:hypothetical protein